MEFDKSSIKYLVGLLFILSIGYIFYLIHKDILYLRNEIVKIQDNIVILTDKINHTEDEAEDITEDITEDIDEYIDEDEDEDEDIDEDEECSYDKHHRNKWDTHSNIFDQFMINSEQLQNLHQNQKDIEGSSTIKEIDTEENTEEENTEENIKFFSGKKKCESVLKSGKNKGNNCGRDVNDDTIFCKLHKS